MNRFAVYSLEELHAAGLLTRPELRAALDTGRLRRLRRGWFASPAANADAVRAVTLGARLGCLSGCAAHGVWTPPDPRLHVVLGAGRRIKPTPGVIAHRIDGPQPELAVCPLTDCLAHVVHRHDPETALICLESAVNKRFILPSTAHQLIEVAPARSRRTLGLFDPASESGTETRVRAFLQRRGVQVRPQVHIPGVGRVDLLVRDRLIIECDSVRYHTAAPDYENDRRRDLAARALGYDVLRLTYHQVFDSWDATRYDLPSILPQRPHRRVA